MGSHDNHYCPQGGDTLGIEIAIRKYLEMYGIKQTFISEKCGWAKQKTNAIGTGKRRITADEYGLFVMWSVFPIPKLLASVCAGRVSHQNLPILHAPSKIDSAQAENPPGRCVFCFLISSAAYFTSKPTRRCRMMATSTRVAVPVASRMPFPLPLISLTATAHSMASLAQL